MPASGTADAATVAVWAPFLTSPRFWFGICGVIGGYLLLMLTNPVRAAFQDGFRAMRRHKALWGFLALFGLGYALFQIALRLFFSQALPVGEQPTFQWGQTWFLPHSRQLEILGESVLPAAESVGGIFNVFVTTFPLSAVAALLFLTNRGGHRVVLSRALRKRFGKSGWLVHGGLLLCGLAAVAKPCVYVALPMAGDSVPHSLMWSQLIDSLSFVFEYLFGICIQIYLILLVYLWVRGKSQPHVDLLDFAIRRFSYVMKWATLVLVISSVTIHIPLVLATAPFTAAYLPLEGTVYYIDRFVRPVLALFLVVFCSMQITLTFHSETLKKAVRDHVHFVKERWGLIAWFLIVAGLHFFALQAFDSTFVAGFGEGTAPVLVWQLLYPTLMALVGGWLLASWVCLFKRCEAGMVHTQEWLKF
jgi:hypothetical protein